MDLDQALARRLATQGLSGPPRGSVTEAVGRLLAVQAQDAPLARWSLAMRTGQLSDDEIRSVVDSGAVIRTHVLRPTWHYVRAEDLRWLLDLTGPKVIRSMASRGRFLGLDDPAVLSRLLDALMRLVAEQPLTRRALQERLPDDVRGERLGHLLGLAELEGLVCSGPLEGGQHTYVPVDRVVPAEPPRDRDDAVRDLTRRFFTGHGPATVAQLTRWAVVTRTEVRAALAELGGELEASMVAGEEHWHRADQPPAPIAPDRTWLLPVFDEAYLTYPGSNFPRTADHPWGESAHSFAEAGGGVVVDAQRDVGWWKRREAGRTTHVTVGLGPGLGDAGRARVAEQAEALAQFTGRALELHEA